MFAKPTLLAALALLAGEVHAGVDDWLSPVYNYIFQFPLPIPPIKQPLTSYTNATTGKTIDFYEMNITSFQVQAYPNLGKATYIGYDAMAPGPTIKVQRGRESVVRFVNKQNKESAIHLHGSFSRAPFDGWALDIVQPGEYKDYYYPNAQDERTLWYHDHAEGVTAVNAYYGQAGFYLLDDPAVDFGLPTGDYDIPLMISSYQYRADGSVFSPAGETDSLWGDVITVNMQPWPYLKVEPRKYRFRLLNSAVSRSFKLYLVQDTASFTRVPFTVVAGDAGYLSKPVNTPDLVISNAERYEIVIDFSQYAGKNMTIRNERDFQTNDDYPATDRVMRFVVGNSVTSTENNGAIPSSLATLELPENHPTVDREFRFERSNGEWLINGVAFSDAANRILAKPKRGKVERWAFINNSGGWSHPIHVHLVDFQVVSRVGDRPLLPYESNALKDVVYLGENERVEVLAEFAPWHGVYMIHCHNLIHEDHEMMAAFNVTNVDLSKYGYDEKVDLGDPENPAFSAKPYQGTDLTQVRNELLPFFQSLNAYPNAKAVNSALASFYATATPVKRGLPEATTFHTQTATVTAR